jgi:hypothetical protein
MKRSSVIVVWMALSTGCAPDGDRSARATPAGERPGAAKAPAPEPRHAESTRPAELPELPWGNTPPGRALQDIEGDRGCIWSAEGGFGPLHIGVDPKDPSADTTWLERLCTVTYVTNPMRRGFTLASKAHESWVPTPARPNTYAFGDGAVFFTYVDPESLAFEQRVVVERREQRDGAVAWKHELGDADDVVMVRSEGVIVVQWDDDEGTRRRMFDAGTGEVLANETLPEAVWQVAHEDYPGAGYVEAFGRAFAEGRAITKGSDQGHREAVTQALTALGQYPQLSKNRIQEFAYTHLDDGTALTFDTRDQVGTLRWVARDDQKVLGTWSIPLDVIPYELTWR